MLVTFVLIDPETNQTLSATEAITILQQGNAQAALFSDNVQAISAFAVAGELKICNVTLQSLSHVKVPQMIMIMIIIMIITMVVSSLHI